MKPWYYVDPVTLGLFFGAVIYQIGFCIGWYAGRKRMRLEQRPKGYIE